MKKTDKYVGLDVHKDTITVAIAEGGRLGEVRQYSKISTARATGKMQSA